MNSTGDKFDFVIVNLKVIAQVPRNRRLRTTTNGNFTLEDNHLFIPLRRILYGEGRIKLIRDIKSLLIEVQSQIRLLLSSKHLDKTVVRNVKSNQGNSVTPTDYEIATSNSRYISDERRSVTDQLTIVHRELERSISGFENLKATYSSDILMVGELDYIIDIVKSYIHEIEQRGSIIPESVSPVLTENNPV
jgi:hypothetical protein